MDDIKDCPYCKRCPVIQTQEVTRRYRIVCMDSLLSSSSACHCMRVKARSMNGVVRKWNRRVDRENKIRERNMRRIERNAWRDLK